jgi:hypothetical protein
LEHLSDRSHAAYRGAHRQPRAAEAQSAVKQWKKIAYTLR